MYYYQPLSSQTCADGSMLSHYCSSIHAQGAWHTHEQHMAAATGILAYELERFMPRQNMRIGRISLDIFGLIYAGDFSIRTQLIRTGKTIELIESTMITQDKITIVARAWRMQTCDTDCVSGLYDSPCAISNTPWAMNELWQGGFIKSIETFSDDRQKGRGVVWVGSKVAMVAGEATSDFVRLMGLVDVANGIVPRLAPDEKKWAFPNLDLQIHLYRQPVGQLLGLQTVQQIGSDGIGLTSSILHDMVGPFGRSEQILTVRQLSH